MIEKADRTFVYQFIYPIIIIYSVLPFFSNDEFDKLDQLVGLLGSYIEIAILHFIIFYLWGRKKSTTLLTVAIGLNVLVVMMQVGVTIFDLDSFTQLGASAIDLELEDSDSLRLVSIFDYLGLFLLIIEIGCLLYLRKRFLQRKQ